MHLFNRQEIEQKVQVSARTLNIEHSYVVYRLACIT